MKQESKIQRVGPYCYFGRGGKPALFLKYCSDISRHSYRKIVKCVVCSLELSEKKKSRQNEKEALKQYLEMTYALNSLVASTPCLYTFPSPALNDLEAVTHELSMQWSHWDQGSLQIRSLLE